MSELREACRVAVERIERAGRLAPDWTTESAADWAWAQIQPSAWTPPGRDARLGPGRVHRPHRQHPARRADHGMTALIRAAASTQFRNRPAHAYAVERQNRRNVGDERLDIIGITQGLQDPYPPRRVVVADGEPAVPDPGLLVSTIRHPQG